MDPVFVTTYRGWSIRRYGAHCHSFRSASGVERNFVSLDAARAAIDAAGSRRIPLNQWHLTPNAYGVPSSCDHALRERSSLTRRLPGESDRDWLGRMRAACNTMIEGLEAA